jgi:2-polyprenyl-3-methyl-5-hydroxy-6-metoxy-1,4-benzoquinol methylase
MLEALPANKTFTRAIAQKVAASPLLHRGKILWEQNQKNWSLPLSKPQKVLAGAYLILSDYSKGLFPPTFADQQKVYETERNERPRPGAEYELLLDQGRRKPFWCNNLGPMYLRHFALLTESFLKLGIHPPAKILEFACGGGWASDFLAQMGFHVVGTTINPVDVEDARLRAESHRVRKLSNKLDFICTPMEEVRDATAQLAPFDAVFVYEALHHAYDWRKACEQAYQSLKPGGWFLMCNEPNILHTLISYRYSQMSRSPEIGFSKREVFRVLKECGFGQRVVLAKRFGFFIRAFWIAFQRPVDS